MISDFRPSRRYFHFVYGVLQSGLTTAIATAIAVFHGAIDMPFVTNWLRAWAISWILMLPVVIFAAPLIRELALWLTKE